MKRPLVWAGLGAGVVATGTILVIVAAGWSPRVEYVLAVELVVVLVGLRLRGVAHGLAPPVWPLPRIVRRDPPRTDPRIGTIEAALRRGVEDAGACRRRVQPALVELAIHRLSHRRGVGLVEDPEAARDVLGDEPFRFLTSVVEEPPTAATIARTVEAIERA